MILCFFSNSLENGSEICHFRELDNLLNFSFLTRGIPLLSSHSNSLFSSLVNLESICRLYNTLQWSYNSRYILIQNDWKSRPWVSLNLKLNFSVFSLSNSRTRLAHISDNGWGGDWVDLDRSYQELRRRHLSSSRIRISWWLPLELEYQLPF